MRKLAVLVRRALFGEEEEGAGGSGWVCWLCRGASRRALNILRRLERPKIFLKNPLTLSTKLSNLDTKGDEADDVDCKHSSSMTITVEK